MNSTKCTACGLVNFAKEEKCRRCGADLMVGYAPLTKSVRVSAVGRSFWEYPAWIAGVTLAILGVGYGSLIFTSDGLDNGQQKVVKDAVAVLEQAGFSQETFALRHLVTYRSTDNWWNRYLGHQNAYAVTNFPFAVVTLYPNFFKYPVDDRERATILLHESYHLFGDNESEALARVWTQKPRLGWTSARYGHTRVFRNTLEWTQGSAPALFTCGGDGKSDCVE